MWQRGHTPQVMREHRTGGGSSTSFSIRCIVGDIRCVLGDIRCILGDIYLVTELRLRAHTPQVVNHADCGLSASLSISCILGDIRLWVGDA